MNEMRLFLFTAAGDDSLSVDESTGKEQETN
jgi:hypothetical protein